MSSNKEYDKRLRDFFGRVTNFSPLISSIGVTSTYVFSVLAIKEVSRNALLVYKNLFENAVLVFGSSLVSSYIVFEYGFQDYKKGSFRLGGGGNSGSNSGGSGYDEGGSGDES